MKIRVFSMLLLILVLSLSAISARADILGVAATYTVLGGRDQSPGITSVGSTVITGNIGVTSAATCTGIGTPPGFCTGGAGSVSGTIDLGTNGDGVQAAFDAARTALSTTPYPTSLYPIGNDLTGQCLGTSAGCISSLAPGVYFFSTTALLNGTLTLAGGASTNPLWIFEMGTSLTVAANETNNTALNSSVLVTGTAAGLAAAGVYWEAGTTVTLGNNANFLGNILAGTTIAFNPGAVDTCGRAFSDTLVSFQGPSGASGRQNSISNTCTQSASGFNGGTIVPLPGGGTEVVPGPTVSAPEPGTLALLPFGLLGLAALKFRKERVSSLSC